MKLLPSRHVLCTPYNHRPCHCYIPFHWAVTLYCIVTLYCTVLLPGIALFHSIPLGCYTVLYCIVTFHSIGLLHCTVLHCYILFRWAVTLYCTALLHCIELRCGIAQTFTFRRFGQTSCLFGPLVSMRSFLSWPSAQLSPVRDCSRRFDPVFTSRLLQPETRLWGCRGLGLSLIHI